MRAIEKFRKQLKEESFCFGAAVTFSDPLISEALAESVDFLWMEMEHSNMSPEVLNGHLLAARSKNVPALVRVAGSGTTIIKPLLDSGVEGIVIPQVRSADEVRQVVDDCRYPPMGKRGYGPRVASNYERNGGKEYLEWANQNIFVAVIIETVEALEALDDILKIPGLDSIVIGAWDLSGSLGMLGDVEHPKVASAIDTIISKTRAAGLSVGCGMPPDVAFASSMIKRGVQWILLWGDFIFLINYVNQLKASIKDSIKSRNDKV